MTIAPNRVSVPRKSRKRPARSPSIATSKTLRRAGGRSYPAHRDWLLDHHGSVCAYCGRTIAPDEVTLDHVRPRKGQTAYDRPDNLVLACPTCNSAKADTPFLAFLLAKRSRGVYLLHYGDHLSEGIKEIVRQVTERPLLPPD
jgi:5-methylcytosine-specific restriction endonuclease McrA